MTVARGVVLSVDVASTEGERVLRFRRMLRDGSYAGDGVTSNVSLDPLRLTKLQAEMQQSLMEFKDMLSEADGPADAFKALARLFDEGCTTVRMLFDSKTDEVREECRKALPFWKTLCKSPLVVEVRGEPENMLPFDFLPMFDSTRPRIYKNISHLEELACRFPAFSAMVMYSDKRSTQSGDTGRKSPILPLKFFRHADLKGAALEGRFFKRRKARLAVDGPWPPDNATSAQSASKLRTALAKSLWNPSKRFDGAPQDPPFQIHHFACHCDTADSDSLQHKLLLKGNGCNNFEVTLRDIISSFGQFPTPEPMKPLVFLNACASAVVIPSGIVSFPSFFKRNKFLGFIGTRTPIPDQWAATYSERFYERILKGDSLGEAVAWAKWSMLRREQNLGGMFYVLYADAFLQLVPRTVI